MNRYSNLHDEPNYEDMSNKLKASPLVLIRHGNSVSNNFAEKLFEILGKDGVKFGQWLDAQHSPDVIDLGLSQKGIEQCLRASEHAKKFNFT